MTLPSPEHSAQPDGLLSRWFGPHGVTEEPEDRIWGEPRRSLWDRLGIGELLGLDNPNYQ